MPYVLMTPRGPILHSCVNRTKCIWLSNVQGKLEESGNAPRSHFCQISHIVPGEETAQKAKVSPRYEMVQSIHALSLTP